MSSRPSQETTVILCLFLVLFLGVVDNQIVSPLLPAIRAQFHKSSYQAGFLFTGYSLCAGVSVLVWGPLSDVFGCKRGLLMGLVLFAFGSATSVLATTFFALMTGRVITGMGASMLSLNTIAYAADFFPYETRGWAMGSIVSSYFAALILGVPLGSYVADKLGWNAVFGVAGAVALLLLISTQWLLPHSSGRANRKTSRPTFAEQVHTYFEFLKTRRTVGALMSSFFASAGLMGFLAFAGVWLHDSFGISAKEIGLVFLASGAAALVASPWAGAISDRIGKRIQFVLSNIMLAVFLLILPGLQWGPYLFAAFGAISLAAAFRQGPMEALLTEIVPSGSRSSFVALKNSCSQLGIGLAAVASGLLLERGGYFAVCVLCAASNLLAAGGMVFLVQDRDL